MFNIDLCKKGIRATLKDFGNIASSIVTYMRLHRCFGIPSLTL